MREHVNDDSHRMQPAASTTLQFNEALNLHKQVIFIAVPKTGTTSIRHQLRIDGPKLIPNPHLTILQVRDGLYTYFLHRALASNDRFPTCASKVLDDAQIRRQAADTFANAFKFASVRNPWARTVSLYQRREGVQVSADMSFTQFCENLRYASDTCLHPTRIDHQLDWMTDEAGHLAVDYVIKLEELEQGIAKVNELTDGRIDLKHRHDNRNPRSMATAYRDFYTRKTQDIIGELFKRDIEFFDYKF